MNPTGLHAPVFRNERFNLVLPRMRLMHRLKRGFEWHYLRVYQPSRYRSSNGLIATHY